MNEKKFSNILNPNQFYLAKIKEDLEGNSQTVNNMNEKSQFKSQLGKFNFDNLHKSPGVTAIVTSPKTPMSPQTPSTIKSRMSSSLSINTIASDDINDSDNNNDIINNMTDNNNNWNDSNKTATSDTCGGASVKHNTISTSIASVIRTSSSSLSSQSSTSSGTFSDITAGQMTGSTSCTTSATSSARKTTKFQSFIQNQEANANFTLASAKSLNEQYHPQQQQKLIISSAYQRQLSQTSASNVTTSSSVLSSSYGAASSSMFSPSQQQPQTPLTPQPQHQQFSFKNDYNRSTSMIGTSCNINNNSDFGGGGGGGLSLGNINEIKIVKSQQMNRKIAILSPNKHFSMGGSAGGVGGGAVSGAGGNSPGIGINRYGFEFFNEMTNNAGFTSSNL